MNRTERKIVNNMSKSYRLLAALCTGFIYLYVLGCASTAKKYSRNDNSQCIPPGLDKATVIKASEVANNNFVSAPREREAERLVKIGKKDLNKIDEFWAYLEQRIKRSTMTNSEQVQFSHEYAKGENSLARWKELSKNGLEQKRTQEAQKYCLQAQQHLEQAIRINPFDRNARTLLALAYYNLQHIFGLQNNFQKAVEILERLTRIEKGEHDLFRLLAENYLALKNYEKALLNLKKAQLVLIKTAFDAPPDSSVLFYYLYTQGDVYAKRYDGGKSIKAFRAASAFARTAQEKEDVENYLKWIKWDGGNVRASEQWDKIIELETSKNYHKMAAGCSKLLPHLKTQKARFDVLHKLAVVEFEFLDRKNKAVERMRQVYEKITKQNFKTKENEYQPFLDTYGAMLYRLGREAAEKQDKKLSLAYFTKAVSFQWDQIAKSYIELVTLLWNNPEQSILYGKKALANNSGLSEKESCELLSLMVRAHKSAGLYDEARGYFNKWKQCRSE